MITPWKQLIKGQITLEEALQLLVDPQGLVNSELLDRDISRRFRSHFPKNQELPPVIPLLLWHNCFYLGTATDLSTDKIKKIKIRTNSEIELIPIAERSYRDWAWIQEIDISQVDPTKFVELFKEKEEKFEDISNFTEMFLLRNKNPTEQLNFIIAGAIHKRASDIHLQPTERGVRIRYRIDGLLVDIVKPNRGIDPRLITALKVMSDMDIAERRCPQDGRVGMNFAAAEKASLQLDMRVNTLPCFHGENAVIRLLPQRNPFVSVGDLGFTASAMGIYQNWIKQPQGMIIITGPTGSGKTSTLYTSLQAVLREFVNVVTIENPVEYVLHEITQSQVNEAAGMTFAAGLRAILRQDPDIIMVGEIRDNETAETAVQAAMTGHLVFTTMHTNDAISVIPRLKGLGLDSSVIAEALLGITAQRLVRKVCPYCAQPYEPTVAEVEYLGLTKEEIQLEKWRKPKGCFKCSTSGYLGRTGIIELINCNTKMKQLIRQGKITEMQRYLEQINFDSFRKAAIEKVTSGLTTVEELQRVIPDSAMHPQVVDD